MWTFTSIRFHYAAKSAETLGPADALVKDGRLVDDSGLESSILISLFTDSRATDQDALPLGFTNRAGFFGSDILEFNVGSKLWLLGRSLLDSKAAALGEHYAKEALAWMVLDGIAERVEVETTVVNNAMIFFITITRPKGYSVSFKFFMNWEAQEIGGYNALA